MTGSHAFTICGMAISSIFLCSHTAFNQQRSEAGQSQSSDAVITILHTNDIHGSYMPFVAVTGNATAQTGDPGRDSLLHFDREGWIGGFAALAAAVKKIRAQKGTDKVLLLDGGDTFADDQLCNITKGELIIRLMNSLSYEMMALGNHDFDYGLQRTRELNGMATFPMRAANIIDEQTGQPLFGEPYKIVKKGGTKIGILTLGYRNTPKTGNPKNVQGLRFITGKEAAKKYIPELRRQADIVVVLSHEGSSIDSLIAEEVDGIDLIIGAHSHDIKATENEGPPFLVQALSDAAVLGELELVISNKKLLEVKQTFHWLWHDEWQPDAEVRSHIEAMRKPHLSELEQKITESNDIIGRQYKSESPFDKLVGNLLKEAWKCDLAILPGVGYGISLRPGVVTSEQIYKLLPHKSKIVILTMSGEQLRKTLEQSATNLRPAEKQDAVGGLIQISGVEYVMNLKGPLGSRVSEVKIKGEPLIDTKDYKVATHDGLLAGLHGYDEIAKGRNIMRTEQPLTPFIIQQLRLTKTISVPKNMGEVTIRK